MCDTERERERERVCVYVSVVCVCVTYYHWVKRMGWVHSIKKANKRTEDICSVDFVIPISLILV